MNRIAWGVLAILLVALPAEGAGPETTTVFEAKADGFAAIRIPAVVVTNTGTVLAFAEGRAAAADQSRNKLVLKRSTDGGKSWGAMAVIADGGDRSLNNPCALVERRTGQVLVMFQSYPAGVTERSERIRPGFEGIDIVRNLLITSNDDGATWSAPRDVTRQTKRGHPVTTIASGPGVGIQLRRGRHAGRLVFPMNEGPFGRWNIYAVYSDDRGATWQLGEAAPGGMTQDNSGGHVSTVNEAQIVELADGTIRCNARRWAGQAVRKTCVSRDGGQSWSPVQDVPDLADPGCMASVCRLADSNDGPKSCLAYSGPLGGRRQNGTVCLSHDEGQTWPTRRTLVPGFFGYSCLVALPGGTIGCLYEATPSDRIAFARLTLGWLTDGRETPAEPSRPNFVFVLADDLGYGDLSCYGQRRFQTPNIDRLATEGVRLTNHYAGSNICAPSRCVLMTGRHPGHSYIRDNRQAKGFPEGQEPVPPASLHVPLLFKQRGYAVGGFGKWGLGPVGSTGDPLKQGFDRWYGYNCQAAAHNYYPPYLWDDSRRVPLNNPTFAAHQRLPIGADAADANSYSAYTGRDYAPDRIAEQALRFVRRNKDRPFVLYYATTVPHLALQVPTDSVAMFAGRYPEVPYTGDRGYLPHRQPRAAYAAMISRMDRDVGRIAGLIRELGLDGRTVFIFASDNGPLDDRQGGTDAEFFNSAGGLRGRKGSFYEGGCRVPCIVRWPGRVSPGGTCDHVTGFEDWLPTLLELSGAADATPRDIDGISFAPTLLGRSQPPRPFLYRESAGYGGQQAVRVGDWKAIRRNLNPAPSAKNRNPAAVELYDLAHDPGEKSDLAGSNPETADRLLDLMNREHAKSTLFPLRAIDH